MPGALLPGRCSDVERCKLSEVDAARCRLAMTSHLVRYIESQNDFQKPDMPADCRHTFEEVPPIVIMKAACKLCPLQGPRHEDTGLRGYILGTYTIV